MNLAKLSILHAYVIFLMCMYVQNSNLANKVATYKATISSFVREPSLTNKPVSGTEYFFTS